MKITVSFLPTKNDYTDYIECVVQQSISKKKKQFFLLFGILILLISVLLRLLSFIRNGEMGILFMLGFFIALFFPVIYPLLMKYQALRFYDSHGEKMNSVSYIFEEETFSLFSDRYEMKNVPYSLIFQTAENEHIFLLKMGENEFRYIPKRVFNQNEYDWLKTKLNSIENN